jgi:hypothetical protein
MISQPKLDEIVKTQSIVDDNTETMIVYVLDDRFNHLTVKEYLETALVVNHYMLLISEKDIAKIDTIVGTTSYIFEEQWLKLSKRNQTFWKRVSVTIEK